MAYEVPFEVPELGYEEALRLGADTGRIIGSGDALLETVVDILDELGRPDHAYDCVQVAGTNGKTSTARFAATILAGEGLRAGLYTSPELVRFEERIEVAGAPVDAARFSHGISAAAEAARRVNARRAAAGLAPWGVSPFDLLTAAALVCFAEEGVDVAVLEVGMGGRWDATSATDPVAVAITGIGLDHTKFLGPTLAAIAGEKAAVIKPGRLVVLGEGTHEPSVQRVMDARCRECGVVPQVVSHVTLAGPDRVGGVVEFSVTTPRAIYVTRMRKPSYQPQNAACAIHLAEAYLGRALDEVALEQSLMTCPTPGRFDVLRAEPLALVDACHNPQSCENFVSALDGLSPEVAGRPTLLFAVLSDKDVAGIVRTLVPAFPRVVVCATDSVRALAPEEAADLVRAELAREGRPATDLADVAPTVAEAVARLTAAGEPFVAAGTITLAGEVTALLRG